MRGQGKRAVFLVDGAADPGEQGELTGSGGGVENLRPLSIQFPVQLNGEAVGGFPECTAAEQQCAELFAEPDQWIVHIVETGAHSLFLRIGGISDMRVGEAVQRIPSLQRRKGGGEE